tara:strand:+ start:374 stop:808 length:435 start_codon:yes stop_codon:yes gene_type:complete
MKKLYFSLIIILLIGCGYEPIYSSKNILFKVDQVYFEENNLNRQIVRSLRSISNQKAKKKLNINLSSEKLKKVVSKTKTGDPEIFELMILVKIEILDIQKNFKSKQNYNNNDNKFKLKEFESEIEKQLVSEIIDEILIYLTLFK